MININVNAFPCIKIETLREWNDPALNDLDKNFITHVRVRIILKRQQAW